MLTVSGLSLLANKSDLLTCIVGPPVWEAHADLSEGCPIWEADQEQTCLEADLSR